MLILGVETSCDDTAVAIVENGRRVLFSRVARQDRLHRPFGGVVPEVASREHLSSLFPLIKEALKQTHLSPREIALLAVTVGPGLRGSLLVGVRAVETLSYLWQKKVVPVNHLQAHLFATFLNSNQKWQFPLLALVVSGGHTILALVQGRKKFQLLGETRDDAAGEAFDKIAQLLSLSYPGGPAIEQAALKIKTEVPSFLPRPLSGSPKLDFSFSGLKTAVKNALSEHSREELIVDSQEAITDHLLEKLLLAYRRFYPRQIVLGGGVVANQRLREKVREALQDKTELLWPTLDYSLDNAAMVASAAYFLRDKATSWYNLEVNSSLSLG